MQTTLSEVADKFDITLEQAEELKRGMSSTWDAIGGDAVDFIDHAELYQARWREGQCGDSK